MTWAQLMELGRAQADTELDSRLGDIAANQCANLCYTSGTTGNPKVIIFLILPLFFQYLLNVCTRA